MCIIYLTGMSRSMELGFDRMSSAKRVRNPKY
jgi:hypothetical protein